MSFFKSKYGISITPEHPINEMVMVAPNKTVSSRGNHGYAFLKGVEDNSLEHQLAACINSPIKFDSHVKSNASCIHNIHVLKADLEKREF